MVEKKEKDAVTESDKIWEEIKNLPIEMFALTNQYVKHHAQRLKVSPNEVYLRLKSGAVVASLEAALARVRGRSYELEVTEGYVIVRRGAPALNLPKPEPSEQ
ncbi:MAG TPA: hypothetical protein VM577_09155 [Anaerovoracaceae bacterium]|nr:hypothetical protein [Anaerovoracaceae bacterium]